MIDSTLIRERYAKMGNQELLNLVQHDAHELTEEAREILQQELTRRGLTHTLPTSSPEPEPESPVNPVPEHFDPKLWNSLLEQKKEGLTDGEMKTALLQQGISETQADELLFSLEDIARRQLYNHENAMKYGGIIALVGLTITALSYALASNGGSFLIAWGAILVGGIRFIRALPGREKYKSILDNIAKEKDDLSNP